ncbi:MAG TPA: hypothetical protein VFN83_10265 [Gemmatimonadales bacterium]|nr:hypothetical protein [Gemmatimonadales bacterium]
MERLDRALRTDNDSEPHPDRFTRNLLLGLGFAAFLWMAPYQTAYFLMGFGLGYWWHKHP